MASSLLRTLSRAHQFSAVKPAASVFTTASTSILKMTISTPSRSIQTSSPSSSSSSQSPRHFLSISDLTQPELAALIKRAADAKSQIKSRKQLSLPLRNGLARQTVAMMFSKRSTRTRVSTEGAVVHLNGHPMFLGKDDIQLGVNESILDTSLVLSSMCSCLVARVGPHDDILALSASSRVPVINALSDAYHPLQALADMLTLKEAFPHHFASPHGPQPPLKLAWVGDANNVLYDLMVACGKSGVSVAVATPEAYPVDGEMLAAARSAAREFGNGAVVEVTTVPEEAVRGADVIVTDTWISMGQESQKQLKLAQFAGYQVTHALAERGGAKPHWKFMHCLPRKPEEVDDAVFYDEQRSLVWTEAENRLYAAIAALEGFVVMGGKICPDGVTGKVCDKEGEGTMEA